MEEVSSLETMPVRDCGLWPSSVLSFLCVTSGSVHHPVLPATFCLNTGQKATEESDMERISEITGQKKLSLWRVVHLRRFVTATENGCPIILEYHQIEKN